MLYQVFIYAIFQGCYIVLNLLGWYFMQDVIFMPLATLWYISISHL